ncbi:hypothetical protein FTX61_19520 [Nitriliruptoraceae bacterium ZYF776]|nr:hypothetical protein [Profundirhabdus halotolerans]
MIELLHRSKGCRHDATIRVSSSARERVVKLVFAREAVHDSPWATSRSVADKVGCSVEAVCNRVPQR